MNLVDKLLQLDANELDLPTADVEIKRLSKKLGEKMIFKCRAIDSDTYNDIIELTTGINDQGNPTVDTGKLQILVAIEGIVSPSLKDEKLLKHFNCATPQVLLNKLLLPGEITKLSNTISELSGFGDGGDEEIKNS